LLEGKHHLGPRAIMRVAMVIAVSRQRQNSR
jgi:hypothetical protein